MRYQCMYYRSKDSYFMDTLNLKPSNTLLVLDCIIFILEAHYTIFMHW